MNTNPMSGYPENPEKQSRLKQIKTLIERHNFLVDQVSILEMDFDDKYKKLNEFKKSIRDDIQHQKKLLEQNRELIKIVEKIKKETSKQFKQIIKKPQITKLQQRIDNLNYGEYIYREEFSRKIKQIRT